MPIYKLILTNRCEIAKNTFVLTFNKPDGFTFTPGQYGGFTLINPPETDAGGPTRRFSLLGSPTDTHLSIVTRFQPSAFKRVLINLPIGSEIKFAGPTGKFILHSDISIPAVCLAGGVGIAPFYSMIQHAHASTSDRPLYLFYGNQAPDDTAFLNELTNMSSSMPHFTFIPTMAKPEPTWMGESGFITETMIRKHITDLSKPIYYICGSPAMVTALQEMLAEMGIDETRIQVEDFPGY